MAGFKSLAFVGNDLIGEFLYVPRTHYGFSYHSRAYFCQHCGEVWARVVVEGFPFYPFYSACERHGAVETGGGSLVDHNAVSDFLTFWPSEVWNRELRLWAEQVIDWAEFSGQNAHLTQAA